MLLSDLCIWLNGGYDNFMDTPLGGDAPPPGHTDVARVQIASGIAKDSTDARGLIVAGQ
ncbi:hypothetical protein CBM2633_U10015 [Cupriavidus taiwanensis]|nr:hypothetical protein CBM2633_U10015 [Cupriavidus taiwanensis]